MEKAISRVDFSELVRLVQNYDPFTCYIDSYSQQVSAEACNDTRDKRFHEIITKYFPEEQEWGITSTNCTNKGGATYNELRQWLAQTNEYKQWSLVLEADVRPAGTRVVYLFQTGIMRAALKFVDDYRPNEGVDERYVETHRSCGASHQILREHFATKEEGNAYYTDRKNNGCIRWTEAQFNEYVARLDAREARIKKTFAKYYKEA